MTEIDPAEFDLTDDANALKARKRPVEHEVTIAQSTGICETLEGDVPYDMGDAILTGFSDEHWPVGRNYFEENYQPVPPTVAGCSGRYKKRSKIVLVKLIETNISVPVADGRARLQGKAGDWLVQYGPGNWGVVDPGFFEEAYELLS